TVRAARLRARRPLRVDGATARHPHQRRPAQPGRPPLLELERRARPGGRRGQYRLPHAAGTQRRGEHFAGLVNTMDAGVGEVVSFWARVVAEGLWMARDPGFDRDFRERSLGLHTEAAARRCDHWIDTADGALALMVLL